MLNSQERRLVYQKAYLPEHIPDYVEAISGAEPFLHEWAPVLLADRAHDIRRVSAQ